MYRFEMKTNGIVSFLFVASLRDSFLYFNWYWLIWDSDPPFFQFFIHSDYIRYHDIVVYNYPD